MLSGKIISVHCCILQLIESYTLPNQINSSWAWVQHLFFLQFYFKNYIG